MNNDSRKTRRFLRAAVACLLASLPLQATASPDAASPSAETIGLEGRVTITLPRGDLRPKPLNDRAPLFLRINDITPAEDGGFTYDLHYMGLEAGHYQITDYLMLPDESPATSLGTMDLHIASILPDGHDGALPPHIARPFPWIGGYRVLIGLFAFLWVAGLVAYIWFFRKRKEAVADTAESAPPSFAEQIRPLVSAAAAGDLSVDDRARLERLLSGYWRDKLKLPDQRMADALAKLKNHYEAGQLLRALEHWLHRPGGASKQDVDKLLAPYGEPENPEDTPNTNTEEDAA